MFVVRTITSADNHDALAILRESKMHCVQKSPLNSVSNVSQRREDCGEVASLFHAEQALDVLQYEELWLVSFNHLHDGLKQRAARVANSKFLARTAERLAGETTGKHIMWRNPIKEIVNIALLQRRAKLVAINLTCFRFNVVRPNCFETDSIRCNPKPTNSTEQFNSGVQSAA